MEKYNKYFGDKDLWQKWGKAEVLYKGKVIEKAQPISSIYRQDGCITVNLPIGSYPLCTTGKDGILKIRSGYKCDELKLIKRNK